ncbi:MAG: hypothetical protein ACQEWG_07045 [Bacteroidota bacterium]
MNKVRILGLLILLLSGSSFSFAVPSGIVKISLENENGYHLSEDFQDLSYSNLVTPLDLFTKRITHSATPLFTYENLRESSRVKGYFSISYLIVPGLGLADIIFPFHSFL